MVSTVSQCATNRHVVTYCHTKVEVTRCRRSLSNFTNLIDISINDQKEDVNVYKRYFHCCFIRAMEIASIAEKTSIYLLYQIWPNVYFLEELINDISFTYFLSHWQYMTSEVRLFWKFNKNQSKNLPFFHLFPNGNHRENSIVTFQCLG